MVVLFMEIMDTLADLSGFASEMATLIKREVDINASLEELAAFLDSEWKNRYNQLVSSGNYRSLRSLARDVMVSVVKKFSVSLGGRELSYWGDALANAFVAVAKIYSDVEPALSEIEGMGIPMYILTNLDNDIAKKILLRNGLLRFFKGVVSSDLTRVGKPNAKIFNAALYRAKANREDALVVSGLVEDVVGCRLSQMRIVFVSRKPVELAVKPDYTINTLTELPPLLTKVAKGSSQ